VINNKNDSSIGTPAQHMSGLADLFQVLADQASLIRFRLPCYNQADAEQLPNKLS
jgi:hypothetical protein